MPEHEKTEELDNEQCSLCGSKKVSREDFNSDAAWREFQFSRLCQNCQDKVILEREV